MVIGYQLTGFISVFSSEKLYVTRHSETRRKISVICYWSCAFTFIVGAVVVAILIGSKERGEYNCISNLISTLYSGADHGETQ